MKKAFLRVILFLVVASLMMFSSAVFAQTTEDIDTLEVTLSKATVNPNQEVDVVFDFGKPLGSFDITIDFDDGVFEYVKTSAGTGALETGRTDKVAVSYFNATDTVSTVSVTFKAKDETVIDASNPTQFTIALSGMANVDDTIRYNAIPEIIKDVMAEPAYGEYAISIEYTEPILKDEEHPIDVKVAATDGRNYAHVRLVAEVTKPEGSAFQLFGTDSASLEHDVILSGWGDAAGFGLGGDVDETYNFTGLFSEDGEYMLTLKLIDRDNSDAVIATTTKNIIVGEVIEEIEEETVLPKTGINFYAYFGIIAVATISAYAIINKKHS